VLNPVPGVEVCGFCTDVYSFGVVVWEIATLLWPHQLRFLPSAAATAAFPFSFSSCLRLSAVCIQSVYHSGFKLMMEMERVVMV
jgi:hypothetical protein